MNPDHKDDPNSQIRMPSLPGLRCFDAAAQLESFSRAADALHLTHGAVSRAVRALEEDLGIALFERRSRRVFLTDAGRVLAKAVRGGFGMIETTVRDLRMLPQDRPLVVSCEPTLLMRWLIPRLPGFQALHPEITIHLVAGGGPVTLGHGIDLAIRRNDFHAPSGNHAYPLFAERIGPVCRTDRSGKFFETSEGGHARLRQATTILHSRTRLTAWEDWEATTGGGVSRGRAAQTFDHFYFSLQAAVAGIGVAIGPWQLVRDDVESGILCAPCAFVEDGSHYDLIAPATIVAGSPQATLHDWLVHIAG